MAFDAGGPRRRAADAGGSEPASGAAIGGCFVCFPRGLSGAGAAGDPAWAAAALGDVVVVRAGRAPAPYQPGLLALREGPLLEAAVAALRTPPGVLLVNATGRDHPRRAGLALHLGAVLGLPTVGVTHRPLVAAGDQPAGGRGATSPLLLDGEEVGRWLVTRSGRRPLAVTPGWRIGLEDAIEVVLACTGRARSPDPLRAARHAARLARGAA
jgi:deoxyribonuclease V